MDEDRTEGEQRWTKLERRKNGFDRRENGFVLCWMALDGGAVGCGRWRWGSAVGLGFGLQTSAFGFQRVWPCVSLVYHGVGLLGCSLADFSILVYIVSCVVFFFLIIEPYRSGPVPAV